MKTINIENLLSSNKFISKQEIMKITGLNERTIRNLVSKLKEKRVVIYNSQTKGWRLAKEYKSMSKIQREEEINQIKHTLEDKKSRIKALKKQMRKDIAYLKKVEQIELEEENYNHIPRID